MRRIYPLLLLMLFTRGAWAQSRFEYSFHGDLTKTRRSPMLFLIEAVKSQPRKNIFVLKFYSMGPMDIYNVKVNFNRKSKRLYLSTERTGWNKEWTLYSNVTLAKIQKCYHSSQTHGYQSSNDNFEMLDEFGCPSKILCAKVFATGPG